MKHFVNYAFVIMAFVIIANLLVLSAHAGDGPSRDIPAGNLKLSIKEPSRDMGYTVGDVLPRTMTFEVKKPYKLIETSLPIVGYERRYRGQVTGIEVRSVSHEKMDDGDYTKYVIHLTYQVFTNNVVAKPAFLPGEVFKFLKPGEGKQAAEVYQYRVPEWGFRVSPIAIFGSVKIEQDMSPMVPPLQISDAKQRATIKKLEIVLGLSLLGLLYIVGNLAWVPLMGRPFSRCMRAIKSCPDSPEGLQAAVSHVHQALNKTHGSSVFGDNLALFIANKPAFRPLQHELERFFALSREVFFEPTAKADLGSPARAWLKQFVRHCRDCERGLNPSIASTPPATTAKE